MVDDVGNMINPVIVKGQIHGGVAQGVGQALAEQVAYDPDSGQLLSGSFMDYAMPRAADFPDIQIAAHAVPTQRNPLGVEGSRRGGHGRRAAGNDERGAECAGRGRGHRTGYAGDAEPGLAGGPRRTQCTGIPRKLYACEPLRSRHRMDPLVTENNTRPSGSGPAWAEVLYHTVYLRPLDGSSVILDLGASLASFSRDMNARFGCRCHAVEALARKLRAYRRVSLDHAV